LGGKGERSSKPKLEKVRRGREKYVNKKEKGRTGGPWGRTAKKRDRCRLKGGRNGIGGKGEEGGGE